MLIETAYIDIDIFPDIKRTKEQANKILEEAAEAYEHAHWLSKYDNSNWSSSDFIAHRDRYFLEMCDCIQALVNFGSSLCEEDGEFQKKLSEANNTVFKKNWMRGRYGEQ